MSGDGGDPPGSWLADGLILRPSIRGARRYLDRSGVLERGRRDVPPHQCDTRRLDRRRDYPYEVEAQRVKEEVAYWREPEKTWVYGGLRIRDGHAVTMCAERRNSLCYQNFLALLVAENSVGQIVVVTDNLSSHTSFSTREWLAEHPRIRQVFIPKNACWLNLQEPRWRMFRRQGLAGQELASGNDIRRVTEVATAQLNAKAKPWIWGRPPPPKRVYRLKMTYRI
jgi:hypothetical protein